jgi:D-galactose 1-dehydrogenase
MTATSPAAPIRIGLVGIGKIARDQHMPVIAADPRFELLAVVSSSAHDPGLKIYPKLEAMLDGEPDLDAVALCTPPGIRPGLARTALAAGKHVLLEKPPSATVAAAEAMVRVSERAGRTLFATWHSRYAPAVEPAREWLSGRKIASVKVSWKEDVRRWHPGQAWIWEAGGFGVFDPGVNALSIVTRILPEDMALDRAELSFPANRDAPIAAHLDFRTASGAPVIAEFDWRQTGPQSWDVEVQTEAGETLALNEGGARLSIQDQPVAGGPEREYASIYDRFAELIAQGRSDVDLSPLIHVADAFLLGRRVEVEAFEDEAAAAR